MFGRKKKARPTPATPAPKPTIIFGSVVVPEGQHVFNYDGYKIRRSTYYNEYDVTGTCQRCGGIAKAGELQKSRSWDEIKRLASLCADCEWLERGYEKDLAGVVSRIKDLEDKREILLAAFAALPSVKWPGSLSWNDLENAGLILHRKDQESVLGFILIDYSRGQMHQLVKTIDGRLEPFSRGFKLFLGTDYYKLFPGSYWWERHGHYSDFNHQSYLDFLRERQEKIEAEAERAKGKIEAHAVA